MIPIQDTFNLIEQYELAQYSGQRIQLKDIAPSTVTRLYKYHIERGQALGWSSDKIMSFTPFSAAIEDLVWGTNPHGHRSTSWCLSRVRIKIGNGKYAVNFNGTWHFGVFEFNGVGLVYPDGGSPVGYGGTTLDMWQEQWIDTPAHSIQVNDLGPQQNIVRAPLVSTAWGNEGTVGAYHELAGVENLHVLGNAGNYFVPGRYVAGIAGWDMGSGSVTDNVYATGVDSIAVFNRSTPADIRKLTGMNGNVTGVLLLGTAGATGLFGCYECDDFPSMVMARPSDTREAGGAFSFTFGKHEAGVTPEARGPWKGTIIADLEGQFCFDFGMVQVATAGTKVDSLFVLKPFLKNGDRQESQLTAKIKRFACPANIIHERGGKVYPAGVGEYGSQEVYWNSDGKVQSNRVDLAAIFNSADIGAPNRLSFQRWNGSAWSPAFNHATGTPAYVYTGATAPPPTCQWVLGPAEVSPCVNGKETVTRKYISDTVGCTPTTAKPADVVTQRDCGITPPPPSGVLLSFANQKATSDTYSRTITPVTATGIRITNLVLSGGGICLANNGSQMVHYDKGLNKWYVSGSFECQVSKVGTVTTIAFVQPILINRLGTFEGAGGALTYTSTKLEILG